MTTKKQLLARISCILVPLCATVTIPVAARPISTEDADSITYYKKVTSAADLVDDGTYLLAGWINNSCYLLGKAGGTSGARRVRIPTTGADSLQTDTDSDDCPYEVTIHRPYSDKSICLLQLNNGNYLTGNPAKNNLTEETSILSTNSSKATGNYNKWTLTTSDSTFTFSVKNAKGRIGYVGISTEAWGCYSSGADLILYRRYRAPAPYPSAITPTYDTPHQPAVGLIYDLNGRSLDVTSTLPPGIYIINGRKVRR